MLCVEVEQKGYGLSYYRITDRDGEVIEAGEVHRDPKIATTIIYARANIYAGYLGRSSKDSEPK